MYCVTAFPMNQLEKVFQYKLDFYIMSLCDAYNEECT